MIVHKMTDQTKSNYWMLLLVVAVVVQLGVLIYRICKLI